MRWFGLIALVMACDAGTRAPTPPLSSSVASAAAYVPTGWVPIEPTDEQRRCANLSDDEWQVAIDRRGQVVVTNSAQREPDTGPQLPFEPKAGDVRGRRHTLAFGDGYLVGFDAGEWGGSLSWFQRDGGGQVKLGEENVHALVAMGPDVAVSLEGLAHMTINEGAVRWIDRSGPAVRAATPTPLPDEPRAAALAADGSVYVLTWSSLVKLTPDRRVQVIQKVRSDGLYADSMAIDASGALWLGMRQFIVRLSPTGKRFTPTWFVRENCQRMTKVDLTCVCH